MAFGIAVLRDQIPDLAVGLIFTLAFLVLDHATLLIQLGLVDGAQQVPHAI